MGMHVLVAGRVCGILVPCFINNKPGLVPSSLNRSCGHWEVYLRSAVPVVCVGLGQHTGRTQRQHTQAKHLTTPGQLLTGTRRVKKNLRMLALT